MKNKITPWDILNYSLQNIFFKGIEVDIAGVQKSEETIANFQWFLRRPSPLNVFGRSDHCHQWFYDGFLMLLPSLSMVFDGSGPLVKRCDGFDGSLWSTTWWGGDGLESLWKINITNFKFNSRFPQKSKARENQFNQSTMTRSKTQLGRQTLGKNDFLHFWNGCEKYFQTIM